MNPSYNSFFHLPHGAAYPPPTFALPPPNVLVPSTLDSAVQTPPARPENPRRRMARPARRGGQWQAVLPTPSPSVSPPETHSVVVPHYAAPIERGHYPSVGLNHAPSTSGSSGSAPGAGLNAGHRTSGPRVGPSGPYTIQHPARTTEGLLPRGCPVTQFGPYAGVVPHASNGSRPISQISLGHSAPAGTQEGPDVGRSLKRKSGENDDEKALRSRRLEAKRKAMLLAVSEDGYRIFPQTPEDGAIRHETYEEEITKDVKTVLYCCQFKTSLRHRKTDRHRLAWGENKNKFVPLIRTLFCHAKECRASFNRSDELVRHHDYCKIYLGQMQAETQAAAQAEVNMGPTPGVVAGDGSNVISQDRIDDPSSTSETSIQQQLQEQPAGSPPTSTLAFNFLDMSTFTAEEVDLFAQLFAATEGAASSGTAPSATAFPNVVEEQLYGGFSFPSTSTSIGQQGALQDEPFDPVTSFPPDITIPDEHPLPQDPWSFFDHAFD